MALFSWENGRFRVRSSWLSLNICVTLGKLLNHSESVFPFWEMKKLDQMTSMHPCFCDILSFKGILLTFYKSLTINEGYILSIVFKMYILCTCVYVTYIYIHVMRERISFISYNSQWRLHFKNGFLSVYLYACGYIHTCTWRGREITWMNLSCRSSSV